MNGAHEGCLSCHLPFPQGLGAGGGAEMAEPKEKALSSILFTRQNSSVPNDWRKQLLVFTISKEDEKYNPP